MISPDLDLVSLLQVWVGMLVGRLVPLLGNVCYPTKEWDSADSRGRRFHQIVEVVFISDAVLHDTFFDRTHKNWGDTECEDSVN